MSRHEIRLRRKRTTARGTERFRNYEAVLKSHEENQRLKKVLRVFTLFAIILILVMLIVMVVRWEQRASQQNKKETSEMVQPRP
jgi:CHASE3 domain sensor protein